MSTVALLSYRDSYFPGPIDAHLWSQVTNSFGLGSVWFIDDGVVEVDQDNAIVFDENGTESLADFEHPENAQYLFGCTGMRDLLDRFPRARSVRIPVPHNPVNQGLFAHQAAAIVMYDREQKQ